MRYAVYVSAMYLHFCLHYLHFCLHYLHYLHYLHFVCIVLHIQAYYMLCWQGMPA